MLRDRIFVIVVMVMAAPAGLAADWNPYVGAGLGKADSNARARQLVAYTPNPCLSTISCGVDSSDTAFELYAGLRFNPHLYAELGYVRLGDVATFRSDSGSVTTHTTQDTDGLRLSLIGAYPIGRAALLGRVGLYRWRSEVRFSNSSGLTLNDQTSGTDLTYGIGIGYELDSRWSLRVMWDRYNDLGDSSGVLQGPLGPARTVRLDTDVTTLSILLRF